MLTLLNIDSSLRFRYFIFISARVNNQKSVGSEVAGAFILAVIESFQSFQPFSEAAIDIQAADIDPVKWYPYSMLNDVLREIIERVSAYESLLFRAGANFIRIWHRNEPGRSMVSSTRDWLHACGRNGVYNQSVRGVARDETGWCDMQSIDDEQGVAVFEYVTPLPPEFVRGLFFGGCTLYDDLDYVDVETAGERYELNPTFHRCIVTVRFRYREPEAVSGLDEKIEKICHGLKPSLTDAETESLVWRYKGVQVRMGLDAAYNRDINTILADAVKTIQKQRDEIQFISNHDTLTGLPNLRLAQDRLKMSWHRSIRENERFALLFLDLDGLKEINDAFGHEAGDYTLKTVAVRLSSCVRSVDTVARHSGDEFMIILTDINYVSSARLVAEKIISAITKPVYYGEQLLNIGISIGIAIFPDHGRNPEELLTNAGKAMDEARRSGTNSFAVFSGR